MKNLLRLEELFLFLLGIWLFSRLEYEWWLFLVLLLTPDISMAGYLINAKIGAFVYNLFHHRGLALAFYFVGIVAALPWLQLIGVIFFSHSSLDRLFGYGLKYSDAFEHTHLGKIGKNKKVMKEG